MERPLAQGGRALSEGIEEEVLPEELDPSDELDAELGEDIALDDNSS